MIFVGGGSLLVRAVEFALASQFRVDSVVAAGAEIKNWCARRGLRLEPGLDINEHWSQIASRCSDGLVFSINNRQLFRGAALAQPSFQLLNVHNGPIPAYRGRPEVCLVYALLHGETHYAATLHRIDSGIDTGVSLDVLEYPLSASDDFESVMLRSLDACDAIFRKNLALVAAGQVLPVPRPGLPSRLYRLDDLNQLWRYRNHPNFRRATQFGVFQSYFPESWRLIERQLQPEAAP